MSDSINNLVRIALISPKGPLYKHKTGIFRKSLRAAPLTLTTLSSLIPENYPCRVTLIDEGIEDVPSDLDVDLVAMTVITGSSLRAYELSKDFRNKGITVVLGGPHVTLMPEEAQKHADVIVTGYAEDNWPKMLWDFKMGKAFARYEMAPDFSLDKKYPFPHRSLLKKRQYATTYTFEATRGCIHTCEFCVVPFAWGTRPFQKPVSHIVEDIKQSGAKRLIFYDLNLIADIPYAKELFKALIPLKIKWFGLSTIYITKDPELLELTAASGCTGLLIGFESLSSGALTQMNKKFNRPDIYKEFMQQMHDAGIAVMGTFVFGNDGDTKDSFEEVYEFVMDSKMELPRYSIMTPFPGTDLYKRLEREGRILTSDWSLYDGQHVVFDPKNMTAQELILGHEELWKKSYSLPSMFKRIVRKIPNFPVVSAANIGYRFYANNLSKFYNCQGGFA